MARNNYGNPGNSGMDEMNNPNPANIMDLGGGGDPMEGMGEEMALGMELSVLGEMAGIDPDQINMAMELPEETIRAEVDAMFSRLSEASGGAMTEDGPDEEEA